MHTCSRQNAKFKVSVPGRIRDLLTSYMQNGIISEYVTDFFFLDIFVYPSVLFINKMPNLKFLHWLDSEIFSNNAPTKPCIFRVWDRVNFLKHIHSISVVWHLQLKCQIQNFFWDIFSVTTDAWTTNYYKSNLKKP